MSDETKARQKANLITSQEYINNTRKFESGYVKNPVTGALSSYPNPAYGGDIFDPNSYIPANAVSSDPNITNPIPQGRFIDPNMPSPQAAVRAKEVGEFLDNPRGYMADNVPSLIQEQSLLDRGKSMLSQLFDYEDEADFSVFGVNLSAVESVWDRALRHTIGFYDLLSVGFGGLISAAPGGLRTLSYDELSGGKNVLEVLNGEMEPGSAPSPGQIAVASVAVEAKRIREGGARLSDVLLMNPATAPFILAGIAAESSPLQQEGFDIMDKEQREKAFGSGWEQWMTGITDAGFAFADPLIGAGVAVKVARAGMLGAKTSTRTSAAIHVGLLNGTQELFHKIGNRQDSVEEILSNIAAQQTQVNRFAPDGDIIGRLIAGEEASTGGLLYNPTVLYNDMPLPETFDNPLSKMLLDISLFDRETGQKVLSVAEIERMVEFDFVPNKAAVADLLHKAPDALTASLILSSMSGYGDAAIQLARLRPAMADTVVRLKYEQIKDLQITEPAKLREVTDKLMKDRDSIYEQYENVQDQLRKMDELPDIEPGSPQAKLRDDLQRRASVLDENYRQAEFLYEVAAEGRRIDPLDATNPFFDQAGADRIIEDMLGTMAQAEDAVTKAIVGEIVDAAGGVRDIMYSSPTKLLYKDNVLSRVAARSRERRREARYQYAAEGTRVIPRQVVYKTETLADGTIKEYKQWEGVWTPSTFEGTSRFRRNVRVWRWMGEQSPSGYIGLKGISTVGSEAEFNAATNLDMYRGNGIEIMVDKFDEAGNVIGQEAKTIGGYKRREELYNVFFAALNDPTKDSLNALKEVENMIADDLARAYQLPEGKMKEMVQKGGGLRDRIVDQVRARGYFVDPDTGEVSLVPYLKSHLANGTYMLNYQQMEKIIRGEIRNDGGRKIRSAMKTGGHYVAEADRVFQNVWRPMTLLRLSYTQRNVFEGLLRAMAYQASLAPLTWPVRGTAKGVRNFAAKRTVGRKVKKAEEAINSSAYKQYLDEFSEAFNADSIFRTAVKEEVDGVTTWTVYSRNPVTKEAVTNKYTDEVYQTMRQDASDRLDNAMAALEENAPLFDASIEDTAFGKWRQKQLKDLNNKSQELDAQMGIIQERIGTQAADGTIVTIDNFPQITELIASFTAEQWLVQKKIRTLRYEPFEAMSEYQSMAGRQKRIGSGTSLGPDGGYYADAFTGPLEQINRDAMSSDNTFKQILSVRGRLFDNFFQRLIIRNHQAVPFSEKTRAQWAQGMAFQIEDASSNRIVGVLVDNNFNVEQTMAWMMSGSKDADDFVRGVSHLLQDNAMLPQAMSDVRVKQAEINRLVAEGEPPSARYRFESFAEELTDPSGGKYFAFDEDKLRAYVMEVSDALQRQMQGRPEFWALLERRLAAKGPKAKTARTATLAEEAVSEAEILRIVDSLTDVERLNLGYVQGSEIIQGGMESVLSLWNKMTGIAFKAIGTIPEDSIVRGPFYNTRFKQVRNDLIEAYWAKQVADPSSPVAGMSLSDIRAANKRARTKNGSLENGTMRHAPFRIEAGELSRIETLAHRQALLDTKTYMYTIDRRTNIGKYGEYLFPFISAQQNSLTVAGKLIYKEPWLPFMVADLWRMPNRLGIEDENGNIEIVLPESYIKDWLAENPDFPFIGGAVDPSGRILIPKDGINTFMPDTGFGVAPRPSVPIQMSASEMMKLNMLPVETPEIFKFFMDRNLAEGEESRADAAYKAVKDYIFGTEGSLDESFLSLGLATPSTLKHFKTILDDNSASAAYNYQTIRATEFMRWKAGERDEMPTHEDIAKRATNFAWFNFFGAIGLPTPLTPYPILTRPEVETPAEVMVETLKKYKQANPTEGSMNFYTQFGDWGLDAATTKISENIAGVSPTAQAVSDVQKYGDLIRSTIGAVGEDNLDIYGMLVNNRGSDVEYDQYAYDWLKAATVPGTNRRFIEIQTPEQADAERQRVVGWTMYRKAMDQLDARLASAGFKSYEAAGAAPLKQARAQLIANMVNNPELEGWATDFIDFGGNRTNAAITLMEKALQDQTFVQGMTQAGKQQILANMNTYLRARYGVIQAVDASGKGINDPENAHIKLAWANIRQSLKNNSVDWADMQDRYLSGDDNPQAPGDLLPNQVVVATAYTMGQG